LLRARIVDSCPPCAVIDAVKAVPHPVGQLDLLPQAPRLIHELLELRRNVAKAGRGTERDPVGPLEIVERCNRLVLDTQ